MAQDKNEEPVGRIADEDSVIQIRKFCFEKALASMECPDYYRALEIAKDLYRWIVFGTEI